MLKDIKILEKITYEPLLYQKSKVYISNRNPTSSIDDILKTTVLINESNGSILVLTQQGLYNPDTKEVIQVDDNAIFGAALGVLPLNGSPNELFNRFHTFYRCNQPQYKMYGTKIQVAYFPGNAAIQIDLGFNLKTPFGFAGLVNKVGDGVIMGLDYNGAPSSSEFDIHTGFSDSKFGNNAGCYSSEHLNYCIPTNNNQLYFFVSWYNPDGLKAMLFDKDFNKLGECNRSVNITQSMSKILGMGGWILDINASGCGRYFNGYLSYISILQGKLNLNLIKSYFLITKKILF